ncbi:uncharacterized protein ACLA_006710 [Aspergillus clavatus NRRL 1]|uniref:Uncharacterized protein n=1 Tax=Aspergillus clavatus (strain ATCC 1007 / CBS 513.65 / DSM 816 / NCTC 3887 / NRRL 1 / QM 1276 / 107) TaxID=344612 RepID=A1CDI6_ASPCL|nr:uncharacterized protein ACLA_006710 [Aspergillus clavatus NRRL 1]EAW11913.1 hypothetical protein ACLA_006710 [Aspergillus clavatus NRRL 1]
MNGDGGKSAELHKPVVLSWRFSAAPSKRKVDLHPSEVWLQYRLTWPPLRQQKRPVRSDDAEQQAHISQCAISPSVTGLSASLDSFCQLPAPLGREDQSLFHSYLLRVPSRVYGTRPDTVFSSVRDVSFPISLSSSLTLQWMLIAAHGLFTHQPMGSSISLSLTHRKHHAYRLLKDALNRSGGVITDEILGGIIMAAITESRLSDPAASGAHLQGYEGALRARGGLRASLLLCSIPAVRIAHIMPYMVCEPPQDPAGGPPNAAQEVQVFVEFLRVVIRQPSVAGSADLVPPQDPRVQLKKLSLIAPSLLRGTLAYYLQPEEARILRFADESSAFLSLFLIALTLWKISDSVSNSQVFITRLITVLELSTAFDRVKGSLLLTDQGFMWVVLKAVLDFGRTSYDLSKDKEVQPIVDSVNAFRAFRRLSTREARTQVRLLLLRLLSGDAVWD